MNTKILNIGLFLKLLGKGELRLMQIINLLEAEAEYWALSHYLCNLR